MKGAALLAPRLLRVPKVTRPASVRTAAHLGDQLGDADQQERQEGASEVGTVQARLGRVVHVLAPRAVDFDGALPYRRTAAVIA